MLCNGVCSLPFPLPLLPDMAVLTHAGASHFYNHPVLRCMHLSGSCIITPDQGQLASLNCILYNQV